MNDVVTGKRSRTLQRGNWLTFTSACKTLELTPHAMAERIGFTESAADGWEKMGYVPKVVEVAALALVDVRAAKLAAENERQERLAVFVLSVPASQSSAVLSVCEALGATLTRVPT